MGRNVKFLPYSAKGWRGLAFGLLSLLLGAATLNAQSSPRSLSVCELQKNPKEFDRKVISVRGSVSLEFEDFSIFEKGCDSQTQVWLLFGGDVASPTISTVNDVRRKPGTDLQVGEVSYGLKKDENFRRLYALITARPKDKPAFRVKARLTGTFLAGDEMNGGDGQRFFGGYGHLGCCSLLIISEVSDISFTPSVDLSVQGLVRSSDGVPLLGVKVINVVGDCCQPLRHESVTDQRGRFRFSNAGPLLHFYHPNFQPVSVVVRPGNNVSVTMKPADTGWVVPFCSDTDRSNERAGFHALFLLGGARSERQDDFIPSFMITRREGPPEDALFVSFDPEGVGFADSTSYLLETPRVAQRWVKDANGAIVGIDMQGETVKGLLWRSIAFVGQDVASYAARSKGASSFYDEVINSVCLSRDSFKP